MSDKPRTDSEKAISSLLFGVAMGDALGVPWEFQMRGSFYCDGMTGYGTHNQPPGTWSDDTSLTLCLADALSRGFALDNIARNFVKWHDEGSFTARGSVFDIGISTAKAIRRLKAGVAPDKAGCAGASENGNGSLMRISPLVFHLVGKPEAERFQITKAVSSITHAHPWSVAACYIFLEYLRKLVLGMEKRAAYGELRGDFSGGHPSIDTDVLGKFARILQSDISALPESGVKSSGFVIDTLEAAIWCFLTTDNYRDAALKAVNLGDDTDTTAAVTGAMAGLFYGLEDIPAGWLNTLAASGEIRRLSGTMAETLPA
jgi:ADP-ribosylglycohydrolase